jgi:hypothetical protein
VGGDVEPAHSTPTAESHNPTSENNPIAAQGYSGEFPVAAKPKFERISADGERYVAHRFRDGFYRMANPDLGRVKHHSANQLSVNINEIVGYLEKGYFLRMRGETSGQVNLIAASEIIVIF